MSKSDPAGESARLERLIAEGLNELGLPAPDSAPLTLASLAVLVSAWGSRMNLTGHRDAESIARRLVLDAAALYAALPGPPICGRVADLGSGAGFPGLPIAALAPERSVFLVESRERRYHFQRQAIRELRLENVRAIRGRFDELDPEPCDLVIAQAVGPPAELVPQLERWARPGGLLAIPTGAAPFSPSDTVQRDRVRSVDYRVPLGGPVHRLWLVDAA